MTANPPVGIAYGFFQCRAREEEIEGWLPIITDAVNSPSDLELALFRTPDLQGEKKLLDEARASYELGRNYVLQASQQGKANYEVAEELKAVLIQLYQSPLYYEGENMKCRI